VTVKVIFTNQSVFKDSIEKRALSQMQKMHLILQRMLTQFSFDYHLGNVTPQPSVFIKSEKRLASLKGPRDIVTSSISRRERKPLPIVEHVSKIPRKLPPTPAAQTDTPTELENTIEIKSVSQLNLAGRLAPTNVNIQSVTNAIGKKMGNSMPNISNIPSPETTTQYLETPVNELNAMANDDDNNNTTPKEVINNDGDSLSDKTMLELTWDGGKWMDEECDKPKAFPGSATASTQVAINYSRVFGQFFAVMVIYLCSLWVFSDFLERSLLGHLKLVALQLFLK